MTSAPEIDAISIASGPDPPRSHSPNALVDPSISPQDATLNNSGNASIRSNQTNPPALTHPSAPTTATSVSPQGRKRRTGRKEEGVGDATFSREKVTGKEDRDTTSTSSSSSGRHNLDDLPFPSFAGDLPWSQRGWLYELKPFRGMYYDVRRRLPYYLSDWTATFEARNLATTAEAVVRIYFINLMPAIAYVLDMYHRTRGAYGINEVILASALAAIVFPIFSVQPLTFVGVTGLINLVNYTQYDIVVEYYGLDQMDYLRLQAWALIWAAGFHFLAAIFNLSDFTRFITDMTSTTFGFYVGIVYIQKGIELLLLEFEPAPLDNATGWLSVTIAMLFVVSVYLVSAIGRTSYLPFHLRSSISAFAFAAGCIFWTGFSHFPKNSLDLVPIENLPITRAFFPTMDRSWFVDFWNIEARWAFVGAPLGFLITLLFWFDHNVSSVMAQARQFPVKRPAGFHWDFFLLGITTLVSGLLGLPAPNGLVPQCPWHTEALSVFKQVKVPKEDEETHTQTPSTRYPGKVRGQPFVPSREQVINTRVVEQRGSHLLIGALTLATMTRPFLVALGTMPRAVFAGIFLLVGWGSIEGNIITSRTLAIFRDRSLSPVDDPLNQVRRSKIALFVAIQWFFFAITFAISQTIAGIGFPVLITLLIPFRYWVVPKWFSPLELRILDAPTADADGVLASIGHESERCTGIGCKIAADTKIAGTEYNVDENRSSSDGDDDDDVQPYVVDEQPDLGQSPPRSNKAPAVQKSSFTDRDTTTTFNIKEEGVAYLNAEDGEPSKAKKQQSRRSLIGRLLHRSEEGPTSPLPSSRTAPDVSVGTGNAKDSANEGVADLPAVPCEGQTVSTVEKPVAVPAVLPSGTTEQTGSQDEAPQSPIGEAKPLESVSETTASADEGMATAPDSAQDLTDAMAAGTTANISSPAPGVPDITPQAAPEGTASPPTHTENQPKLMSAGLGTTRTTAAIANAAGVGGGTAATGLAQSNGTNEPTDVERHTAARAAAYDTLVLAERRRRELDAERFTSKADKQKVKEDIALEKKRISEAKKQIKEEDKKLKVALKVAEKKRKEDANAQKKQKKRPDSLKAKEEKGIQSIAEPGKPLASQTTAGQSASQNAGEVKAEGPGKDLTPTVVASQSPPAERRSTFQDVSRSRGQSSSVDNGRGSSIARSRRSVTSDRQSIVDGLTASSPVAAALYLQRESLDRTYSRPEELGVALERKFSRPEDRARSPQRQHSIPPPAIADVEQEPQLTTNTTETAATAEAKQALAEKEAAHQARKEEEDKTVAAYVTRKDEEDKTVAAFVIRQDEEARTAYAIKEKEKAEAARLAAEEEVKSVQRQKEQLEAAAKSAAAAAQTSREQTHNDLLQAEKAKSEVDSALQKANEDKKKAEAAAAAALATAAATKKEAEDEIEKAKRDKEALEASNAKAKQDADAALQKAAEDKKSAEAQSAKAKEEAGAVLQKAADEKKAAEAAAAAALAAAAASKKEAHDEAEKAKAEASLARQQALDAADKAREDKEATEAANAQAKQDADAALKKAAHEKEAAEAAAATALAAAAATKEKAHDEAEKAKKEADLVRRQASDDVEKARQQKEATEAAHAQAKQEADAALKKVFHEKEAAEAATAAALAAAASAKKEAHEEAEKTRREAEMARQKAAEEAEKARLEKEAHEAQTAKAKGEAEAALQKAADEKKAAEAAAAVALAAAEKAKHDEAERAKKTQAEEASRLEKAQKDRDEAQRAATAALAAAESSRKEQEELAAKARKEREEAETAVAAALASAEKARKERKEAEEALAKARKEVEEQRAQVQKEKAAAESARKEAKAQHKKIEKEKADAEKLRKKEESKAAKSKKEKEAALAAAAAATAALASAEAARKEEERKTKQQKDQRAHREAEISAKNVDSPQVGEADHARKQAEDSRAQKEAEAEADKAKQLGEERKSRRKGLFFSSNKTEKSADAKTSPQRAAKAKAGSKALDTNTADMKSPDTDEDVHDPELAGLAATAAAVVAGGAVASNKGKGKSRAIDSDADEEKVREVSPEAEKAENKPSLAVSTPKTPSKPEEVEANASEGDGKQDSGFIKRLFHSRSTIKKEEKRKEATAPTASPFAPSTPPKDRLTTKAAAAPTEPEEPAAPTEKTGDVAAAPVHHKAESTSAAEPSVSPLASEKSDAKPAAEETEGAAAQSAEPVSAPSVENTDVPASSEQESAAVPAAAPVLNKSASTSTAKDKVKGVTGKSSPGGGFFSGLGAPSLGLRGPATPKKPKKVKTPPKDKETSNGTKDADDIVSKKDFGISTPNQSIDTPPSTSAGKDKDVPLVPGSNLSSIAPSFAPAKGLTITSIATSSPLGRSKSSKKSSDATTSSSPTPGKKGSSAAPQAPPKDEPRLIQDGNKTYVEHINPRFAAAKTQSGSKASAVQWRNS